MIDIKLSETHLRAKNIFKIPGSHFYSIIHPDSKEDGSTEILMKQRMKHGWKSAKKRSPYLQSILY